MTYRIIPRGCFISALGHLFGVEKSQCRCWISQVFLMQNNFLTVNVTLKGKKIVACSVIALKRLFWQQLADSKPIPIKHSLSHLMGESTCSKVTDFKEVMLFLLAFWKPQTVSLLEMLSRCPLWWSFRLWDVDGWRARLRRKWVQLSIPHCQQFSPRLWFDTRWIQMSFIHILLINRKWQSVGDWNSPCFAWLINKGLSFPSFNSLC